MLGGPIGDYMWVSQNYGYLFGGPNNKDYSLLGSILGSPYFGKLPYRLLGAIFLVQGSYHPAR